MAFTLTTALEFARASAADAIDQAGAYVDSVASYRENLRDTLNDENSSEHEQAAFDAYDAAIVVERQAAEKRAARGRR